MRWIPLVAVFTSSLACLGPGAGDSELDPTGDTDVDSNDSDGDRNDDVVGPSNVVLSEVDGGLRVTISGGIAPGWRLGAIHPRTDFYEEDCLDSSDLCHSLAPDGGVLRWCLGETPTDSCTAIAQLYYRQGKVSFVLKPSVGVGCWVWGEDASYYRDLGCQTMAWDPTSQF